MLTGYDVKADRLGGLPPNFMPEDIGGPKGLRTRRPILVSDRVRCVGDRVAMVVAQTLEQARDASELIAIDYEPLPAVANIEDAVKPGAPAVWDECPGNVSFTLSNGDEKATAAAFANAALPFELFYACEVEDCRFVEARLHDAFGDHRISKKREFFRIAPERVKAALSIAAVREIKLGDEIFESNEAKAEVESAKRRARFRLSMIGIKPGTELQLEKDPVIICKTVDDINQVEFRGDITSLSDAALQAIRSLGYEWDLYLVRGNGPTRASG